MLRHHGTAAGAVRRAALQRLQGADGGASGRGAGRGAGPPRDAPLLGRIGGPRLGRSEPHARDRRVQPAPPHRARPRTRPCRATAQPRAARRRRPRRGERARRPLPAERLPLALRRSPARDLSPFGHDGRRVLRPHGRPAARHPRGAGRRGPPGSQAGFATAAQSRGRRPCGLGGRGRPQLRRPHPAGVPPPGPPTFPAQPTCSSIPPMAATACSTPPVASS